MAGEDQSTRPHELEPPAPGWVAFEIPGELRLQAEQIIERIRADADRRRHAGDLAELVVEMIDRGLDYYFLYPLEEARVGAMTRRAVEFAIGTAGRTLPTVVRKTVKSLNDEQLLSITEFIDHMLISEEPEEADEA